GRSSEAPRRASRVARGETQTCRFLPAAVGEPRGPATSGLLVRVRKRRLGGPCALRALAHRLPIERPRPPRRLPQCRSRRHSPPPRPAASRRLALTARCVG